MNLSYTNMIATSLLSCSLGEGAAWYKVNALLPVRSGNNDLNMDCVDLREFEPVEKQAATLDIFPNPATEELYIHMTDKLKGKKYYIYDSMGGLQQTGRLNQNRLSLQRLNSTGMYILKIEDRSVKFFVVK